MAKEVVVDTQRTDIGSPYLDSEVLRKIVSDRFKNGWDFVTVVSTQGQKMSFHHLVFSRELSEEGSLPEGLWVENE